MNENIYLSRINIPSFRDYIFDFSLDIPNEPGLTVIVGANGLGKSTILHGIEWCLTGKIERFEKAPASSYQKSKAIGQNASVSLGFSNQNISITRDVNFNDNENSELEKLIRSKFIKSTWQSIEDLSASFQFTHFRGQSALQHFTNQKGPERFHRLEGVSRLGELISAQQKLERPKTTQAFNKLRATFNEEKEKLSKIKEEYTELSKQKKDLISLARAENVMAPNEIKTLLLDLKGLICNIEVETSSCLNNLSESEDILNIFETLQKVIQVYEDRSNKDLGKLEIWQKTAEIYENLGKTFRECVENKKSLEVKNKRENEEQQRLDDQYEDAKKNTTIVQKKLDDTLRKLQLLRDLTKHNDDLLKKEKEVTEISDKLNDSRKKIPILEQSFKEAEKNFFSADKIGGEINKCRLNISHLEKIKFEFDSAFNKSQELRKLKVEYISAQEEILQLNKDEKILQKQSAEVRLKQESTKRSLYEASQIADEVQKAVASIASKLSDEDTTCPVCSSNHEKGELRRIAQKAASYNSPQIIDLENKLKNLLTEQNDISQKQDAIKNKKNTLKQVESNYLSLKRQVDEEIKKLQSRDIIKGISFEKINDALLESKKIEKERLVAFEKILPKQSEINILAESKNKVAEKLQAEKQNVLNLERIENQCKKIITDLKGKTEHIINELQLCDDDLNRLTQLVPEHATLQAKYEHKFAEAKETESRDETLLKQKIESNKVFSESIKDTQDKLDNTINEKNNLENKWERDGFRYTPTKEMVRREHLRIQDKLIEYKSINEKYNDLLESYKLWKKQEDIKNTDIKIRKLFSSFSAESENDFWDKLKKKEEALNKKVRNLNTAEIIRDSLKEKIRSRLDKVETETFQPLNDILKRFSTALMTGWEYDLAANAVFKKSSSDAGLVLTTNKGRDLLPQLALSEGQMAAVELSLMLSASEIYPWSPWRALILDDPLQHNDTVQASSVIEILRTMIKEQGYQVIITTHDVDEASYFLRKCRNVGVTTQYCHLLSKVNEKLICSIG